MISYYFLDCKLLFLVNHLLHQTYRRCMSCRRSRARIDTLATKVPRTPESNPTQSRNLTLLYKHSPPSFLPSPILPPVTTTPSP